MRLRKLFILLLSLCLCLALVVCVKAAFFSSPRKRSTTYTPPQKNDMPLSSDGISEGDLPDRLPDEHEKIDDFGGSITTDLQLPSKNEDPPEYTIPTQPEIPIEPESVSEGEQPT